MQARPKVLHLLPSFHQGGSEKQALQLVKSLIDDGAFDIRFACMDTSGVLLPEAEKLSSGPIEEYRLSSFYDLNMFRQVRRFARRLREDKIDIIQTHDFYSNIFGMTAASLARVPVGIAAKRETGMRTEKQLFMERRAFAISDVVIANSQKVRNYLAESGVPKDKIEVIYNGVDQKRFSIKGDVSPAEFGLPVDENIRFVTIVANLRSTVKNHRMFLRAAAATAEKIRDAHFIVAGEGELLDELKAFANELGIAERVHFIGRCTSVERLLKITSICSLTSFSEGFSNSLIEYMAAGKPVVATDVGGASEALTDGVNGFLVASDDDTALASRFIELLSDPEKIRSFGDSGRDDASRRFSVSAQTDAVKTLYERELARLSIK